MSFHEQHAVATIWPKHCQFQFSGRLCAPVGSQPTDSRFTLYLRQGMFDALLLPLVLSVAGIQYWRKRSSTTDAAAQGRSAASESACRTQELDTRAVTAQMMMTTLLYRRCFVLRDVPRAVLTSVNVHQHTDMPLSRKVRHR